MFDFIKKDGWLDNPWKIFIIIAFIFGSLFMFITPPFEVPDEPYHLLRACEVADGVFYNKIPATETKYDIYFEDMLKKYMADRAQNEFHCASRNSALMYIPSALGIKIGSRITLLQNQNTLFYLCRLLNLLLYIILVAFAIKITPVFKYPFMFTALLPMALYEGMSLSADSFNNGFAFLFFAYVFKLLFQNEEIKKKDFSILALFSIIGAFCKAMIYPLCLFFLLPKFSKEFKFNKWFYIIFLIIAGLFLCYFWISINHKNINYAHPVINDSLYILKYPFDVISRLIYTTFHSIISYMEQCIGVFGWLHIYLNTYLYVFSYVMFASMFVFIGEKIQLKYKILSSMAFIVFYSLIQYVQMIYWSKSDSILIVGFQGRYFLPMFPLLFVAFANNKFKISDKYQYIYKIILIMFIVYLLIKSVMLLHTFYTVHHFDRFIMDSIINQIPFAQ